MSTEEQGAAPPAPVDEDQLLDDQADAAEDFIHGLLDILDLDGEAEAEIDGDAIFVDVTGPDLALLIGRHGATLEALQDLVRAVVQHQTSSFVRLTLDVGGYRERQREILERRARGIAAKVRRDGTPYTLEPMTSYERKLVHDCLVDFDGVSTSSVGEDPERRVVISPA